MVSIERIGDLGHVIEVGLGDMKGMVAIAGCCRRPAATEEVCHTGLKWMVEGCSDFGQREEVVGSFDVGDPFRQGICDSSA